VKNKENIAVSLGVQKKSPLIYDVVLSLSFAIIIKFKT